MGIAQCGCVDFHILHKNGNIRSVVSLTHHGRGFTIAHLHFFLILQTSPSEEDLSHWNLEHPLTHFSGSKKSFYSLLGIWSIVIRLLEIRNILSSESGTSSPQNVEHPLLGIWNILSSESGTSSSQNLQHPLLRIWNVLSSESGTSSPQDLEHPLLRIWYFLSQNLSQDMRFENFV